MTARASTASASSPKPARSAEPRRARGTLVHAVLRASSPPRRPAHTPPAATALAEPQWARLVAEDPELRRRSADEAARPRGLCSTARCRAAGALLPREDPNRLAAGRARACSCTPGSATAGLPCAAFVDRLGRGPGRRRSASSTTRPAGPVPLFRGKRLPDEVLRPGAVEDPRRGPQRLPAHVRSVTARSSLRPHEVPTSAPPSASRGPCGRGSARRGRRARPVAANPSKSLQLVRTTSRVPRLRRHPSPAAALTLVEASYPRRPSGAGASGACNDATPVPSNTQPPATTTSHPAPPASCTFTDAPLPTDRPQRTHQESASPRWPR